MPPPTKDRILDVAEQLFAEQGFGATSMRAITNEAAVNLAAINYHFGSKEGLVQAIFSRRLVPMNAERLKRLRALEATHGVLIPLEDLVRAFIGPALELSRDVRGGGARFIRLLGRSYTESSGDLQDAVRGMYQEVIERFKPAFAAALPGLDREELYWRLHFVVGTLAYCMAGSDMMRLIATSRLSEDSQHEKLMQRLTAFLTAGLEARPSDPSIQSPVRVAAGAHPSS